MNLATPLARLTAALTLVTLGLAGPAAAQCVKSQSNLTIELLLDGRNTGGTFTYVWDVTYDPATPWITELYFQKANGSDFTSVNVNPDYTTWTFQDSAIPTTSIDALQFTYASGFKLQKGRSFTFNYTTAFQDPVRVHGRASDGSVYDQTFTSSDCQFLPVELAAFDARADGASAALAWTTVGETNNAGFEVEHRADAASAFASLGFVDGAGTTTERQQYAFRADGLAAGRHAFRLRQVDFDGRASYGPVVEVEIGLDAEYAVGALAPNPVGGFGQLSLTVQRAQRVTAEAFDMLGRRVALLADAEVGAGTRTPLALDANGLAPGLYVLRVTGETFRHAQPFTVAR